MEKTVRTFIAIKIIPDNNFIQLYSTLKETFKDDVIKWTKENNFHITLRFLGDTTSKQLDKIKLELKKIAGKFNPFSFTLKGLGYFKSKGKPRVLFAKTENTQTLKLLTAEIEKHIARIGFEKETKEFKPHLTLGRIKFLKEKDNFFSGIQKFEEIQFQQINVSELIFYQSVLNSDGPVYKPFENIKIYLK